MFLFLLRGWTFDMNPNQDDRCPLQVNSWRMYNYEKIEYIEKKKEFILKRVRNKNVWYRPVVEMLKKDFCNKIRILLSRFEIRD